MLAFKYGSFMHLCKVKEDKKLRTMFLPWFRFFFREILIEGRMS